MNQGKYYGSGGHGQPDVLGILFDFDADLASIVQQIERSKGDNLCQTRIREGDVDTDLKVRYANWTGINERDQ